jgi:PhnB protein
MTSVLNPYISFDGDARDAAEFYQSVLGGELTLNTFAEYGGPPEKADQIMHGQLKSDAGFTLMVSDTPPGSTHETGNNFSISLSGDDHDDLRRYWEALTDGGTITVPLEKQPWGDEFGMVIDKFGVAWMVNIGV